MKRTSLILAGFAAAFAGAAAEAQTGDRGRGLDRMFSTLDTNGDGAIDRAELDAGRMMRFDRMDANGDGVLTLPELQDAAATRAADKVEKRFSRLDRNGDGGVDRTEMAAAKGGRHGRMMKRLDADGDGRITRAEAEAMKARRKAD